VRSTMDYFGMNYDSSGDSRARNNEYCTSSDSRCDDVGMYHLDTCSRPVTSLETEIGNTEQTPD
jgi:hypothetical protein